MGQKETSVFHVCICFFFSFPVKFHPLKFICARKMIWGVFFFINNPIYLFPSIFRQLFMFLYYLLFEKTNISITNLLLLLCLNVSKFTSTHYYSLLKNNVLIFTIPIFQDICFYFFYLFSLLQFCQTQ